MSDALAQAALLAGRGLQFAAAMLLFGAPMFGLCALRGEVVGPSLVRGLVVAGVAASIVAAALMLMGQAASMSGAAADALRPGAWFDVLSDTQFGRAWMLRLGLLAAMATAGLRRSSRWTYQPMAAVGALLTASLAWMGHGGAGEGVRGQVHLIADMAHLLAAAAWLGGLAPLLWLVIWARRGGRVELSTLARRALERFSGLGTAAVAVLVASGAVNGWFLIGRRFPGALTATAYGRILSVKLLLFVGMLSLAAFHRWGATPGLAAALDANGDFGVELDQLKLSLALETALAIGVLALVAWLGVIEPPLASD